MVRHFDSERQLLALYRRFKNKPVVDVFNSLEPDLKEKILAHKKSDKGRIGLVMEGLTGRYPNSEKTPDIAELGIEIKTFPLEKFHGAYRPKYRAKINSINYKLLPNQEWETCSTKLKMNKILFISYYHEPGCTLANDWEIFKLKDFFIYYLDDNKPEKVQNDWEYIKNKVSNLKAHELSEGDTDILGAATSGKSKIPKYYHDNAKPAKTRSFALKRPWFRTHYEEYVKKKKFESSNELKVENPSQKLVSIINDKISGHKIGDLINDYNIVYNNGAKSFTKLVINRILGITKNAKIREIEQNDIEIRAIPIRENYNPWEAMSFPKMSLVDLVHEDWNGTDDEESVFRREINKTFIFIPIVKKKVSVYSKQKNKNESKFEDYKNWKFLNCVEWRPSQKDLNSIQEEWEKCKTQIVENNVKTWLEKQKNKTIQRNNLLKSSESEYIHIRPHTTDSSHIDIPYQKYTNGRIEICWQSFWFNKTFVQSIISVD